MDSTKAEQLGREAVALGMPCVGGALIRDDFGPTERTLHGFNGWLKGCWPDFRDRLTALACLAWCHDVAAEAFDATGTLFVVKSDYHGEHKEEAWGVSISVYTDEGVIPFCLPTTSGPEACIAAVKAMRGGRDGKTVCV